MARAPTLLLALALVAVVAQGQDEAADPVRDGESGAAPAAVENADSKVPSGEATDKSDEATDKSVKGAPAPTSPFGAGHIGERPDARPGVVELSDGTTVPGQVYGTRGQALVIFGTADAEEGEAGERWRRVPWGAIRSIETRVDWERMDREWRFRTAGDPEKVYTGKTYPNRRYSYAVTLSDGKTITGRIKGVPIYIRPPEGKSRMLVLHERHKGEVGTTIEKLVYVRSVRLGEDVRREAEERLRASAEAKSAAEDAETSSPPTVDSASDLGTGGSDKEDR